TTFGLRVPEFSSQQKEGTRSDSAARALRPFARATTLIQVYLLRQMPPLQNWHLLATALISTAIALPLQLFFWWVMAYLPSEFSARLRFVVFFLPAFPASLLAFGFVESLEYGEHQ